MPLGFGSAAGGSSVLAASAVLASSFVTTHCLSYIRSVWCKREDKAKEEVSAKEASQLDVTMTIVVLDVLVVV